MASIEEVGGGRWRVRWRERSGDKWKSRERTVKGSKRDAEAFRLRVEDGLEAEGRVDLAKDKAQHAPPADLIAGLHDYVAARRADNRICDTSANKYREWVSSFARRCRKALGLAACEPLPVTLLTRETFDRVKAVMVAEDLSPTYMADIIRVVLDAWCWMADEPETYPQVPRAPYHRQRYLPAGRVYGRTEAPTLAHADMVLRTLAGRTGRKKPDLGTIALALLLRYTGLRSGQVLGAMRCDLDVKAATLWVRKGKSRREKADSRTVPLGRHLFHEPLFLEHLEHTPSDGPLVPVAFHPSRTMSKAWEDSGVPRRVWNPPNRIYARPLHAFRACFIAHLRDHRTPSDVINFLVGHAAGSDRMKDTHYGRALLIDAREVVDELPPVQWKAQADEEDGEAEDGDDVREQEEQGLAAQYAAIASEPGRHPASA